MRTRFPPLRTEPSRTYRTPNSRPTCFTSTAWPLYVKLELRAMTKSQRIRESAVIISSTMPSAKYSCSGSPLMLAKGNTAIDGLSGRGKVADALIGWLEAGAQPTRYTRRGRAMFFRLCSPRSANSASTLPRTCRKASSETQIPPGSAMPSGGDVDAIAEDVLALDQNIAEMYANAPFHSAVAGNGGVPLCRQVLQRQGTFDSAYHRAKLDQHPVAGRLDYPPAALPNNRIGSGAMLAQRLNRARLVEPHQPAVTGDIGRKDGGEATCRGHGCGSPPGRRSSALSLPQLA